MSLKLLFLVIGLLFLASGTSAVANVGMGNALGAALWGCSAGIMIGTGLMIYLSERHSK